MFQKEPWNWPESAKRQKNERKYAMNSSDRKLHHDKMEGSSGGCFIWKDKNVALPNDTNFGTEISRFFALSFRLLGMKKKIS